MNNRTFTPAIKANLGGRIFYTCLMKYAELSRRVESDHEFRATRIDLHQQSADLFDDLNQTIESSPDAMIVVARNGVPEYLPFEIDSCNEFAKGIESGFGFLIYDSTQQFFAFDGEQRLKAIKRAIVQDSALAKSDICVLVVTDDNAQGVLDR